MAKAQGKEETREVFIPKESRNDPDQFVSVDGKTYLLQKGKTIAVPWQVAEVIENALAQKAKAQAFIDANAQQQ